MLISVVTGTLILHLTMSAQKTRSGYVILFAGYLILWASKLQTQIAISTTEDEYIAMSQSLRDTIPIMNFLKKLKSQKLDIISVNCCISFTTAFTLLCPNA